MAKNSDTTSPMIYKTNNDTYVPPCKKMTQKFYLCGLVRRIINWVKDDPHRLGWMVSIACFVLNTTVYSIVYGFPLLFEEFLDDFNAKVSITSYVGCVMSAISCLSSPLTALLLSKLSHRSVCILGILLCSLGAFTSSLVPSIYYLFLTLGICYGLGLNFVFHSMMCLQLEYFPTNSELPVTISSSGISISWMATVPLLHYFISLGTWRTGVQLMSAVILCIGLVSCIALCPVPKTHKQDNKQDKDKTGDKDKDSKKSVTYDPENHECKEMLEKLREIDRTDNDSENSMKAFLCKPEAWMYFICIFGTQSGWCFYFINIVNFLTGEDSVRLNDDEAASIVFMSGFGEIAGKIILIAIARFLHRIPSLYIATIGNILAAVFTMGLLVCTSYVPAAAVVILASLSRTIWHVYPISGGMEELKYSNGVSTMFLTACGFAYLFGAFVIGGIYDMTGSYDVPMVLTAAIFIISGFCYLLVRLISFIKSRKQKKRRYSVADIHVDTHKCGECRRKSMSVVEMGGSRRKSRSVIEMVESRRKSRSVVEMPTSSDIGEMDAMLAQCNYHQERERRRTFADINEDVRLVVEHRISTV